MDNDYSRSNPNRRIIKDRRSGTDTRSDAEKQLTKFSERRTGLDRRSERKTIQASARPANEQVALFARRLRRALGSERGRDFFGVARGEYDFVIYPDVLRTLEWLEALTNAGGEEPADQGKITLRKALPHSEM
jgi:hypothetical protein